MEKLTGQDASHDMADGIEKEELRDDERLDQHDETRNHARQEDDNIHHPDDVEDDITWPGQRFLEERHVVCGFGGGSSNIRFME